jgi:Glycosyltransferases involved in cell wall biogenesis
MDQRVTNEILVSVVVIAFNEEKRILPCIWSLTEQQTNISYEIIVVNNASTDHTQEILDRCGVRSVFQPLKGVGYARQAGLDVARGKYLFTADADTIYPPLYLNIMLDMFKPGISGVFTHCRFIPDGKKSALSLATYEIFRNLVVRMRSIHRPELSAGGASMAFVTEYGKQIGFRTDILRGEDGAMIGGLKTYGKIRLVSNKSVYVLTTSRTLDADGGFGKLILMRLLRECMRIGSYLYPKKVYKDRESNLIK